MLTPFTVFTPGNIRFGRGLARSAAPWLAQRTAKVLLVHGASAQRAGFYSPSCAPIILKR